MLNIPDLTPQRRTALLAVPRIALDSRRYYDLKQYKQGESRLRQALAARKNALRSRLILFDGPESEDVNIYKRAGQGPEALYTLLLTLLGLLERDLRQYAEAEPLLLEALRAKLAIFGDEHREVAPVLDALASVYQAQGRYDETEPLLLRSLAIVNRDFGPESARAVWALYNLANLYHLQGRVGEAMPLMRDAVRVRKLWEDPERVSKDTAVLLTDYAHLLRATGDAGRAARIDHEMKEICDQL